MSHAEPAAKVVLCASVNVPGVAGVLRRTDTELLLPFATAKSIYPSLLKSAAIIPVGPEKLPSAVPMVEAENVPGEPVWERNSDTVLSRSFATAKSGRPSRLKSPTAKE